MVEKAWPRLALRYTNFLVSASAHTKRRNDDLDIFRARREKQKNSGVRFGDPLFEEKTRKKNIFLECFFDVPRVFQSSSPELRSMSGRKESSWDALGPEFYGVRPRILARAEYSARAQHTFRSFHINPTWNQLHDGGVAQRTSIHNSCLTLIGWP